MTDDQMLTPKEAAAYLHTTENSLRTLRSVGKGPPFQKPDGWHTLYRKGDLDEYQEACGPSGRKKRMNAALAEKKRAAAVSTPLRP